jgi:hypothetical protein
VGGGWTDGNVVVRVTTRVSNHHPVDGDENEDDDDGKNADDGAILAIHFVESLELMEVTLDDDDEDNEMMRRREKITVFMRIPGGQTETSRMFPHGK